MPPIRTMPTVKPVRTERTHEENQERAYIAASRRSDRSLEARVESARRASEIHKKRTGRSLRVREEDVMNEEMYEEEDDDLPMQFRRINALHPGLAYNNPAFTDRVNNYLAGQIGVRNYLHQAIFQANQSQYANQFLNPMMQNNFQAGTMSPQAMNGAFNNGQPQSPWPSMQNVRPSSHGHAASIQQQQPYSNAATPMPQDSRRPSLPVQQGTSPSHSASSLPPSPHPMSNQKSGQSPQQVPTPPSQQHARVPAATPPTPGYEQQQMYPLTTKLPIETQQLIDGQPAFANAVSPSQLTPGVPMPSMGTYSYNPNGKPKKSSPNGSPSTLQGLDQTLTSFPIAHSQPTPPVSEPQSAASASSNLEFGFDNMYKDFGNFDDSSYGGWDMNFGASTAGNSGQVTPEEVNWNDTDFFNYAAASD
ncbi:Hypothetical predicted protein [Lecanosticta acicola]|uniref:Uncharacterized protein n=1 Tax=Lecanosticta acicola TaxID=111012 RepID=A0AAI8YZI0_9PEZI|nr:Hypothetical predicted protein [Lecanosticta acicola]